MAELSREVVACADALHSLARYLTGNDSDAEDLVQETYARALRAADQFTPGTNVKAWLATILRNTFYSLSRRRNRSPTWPSPGNSRYLMNAPSEPGFWQEDVRREQWRPLIAEEIESALMALSEESRTVILLHLEGLTDAETASVLGCPVGTVKSRLARARRVLRRRLRDYARR